MKDLRKRQFRRLVIMGESTVEGGPWLPRTEDRFADILADLINRCQNRPVEYFNKGIGANCISQNSPGYEASAKPSALERYREDVIALDPDLFILCYGLNDMRAGMPLNAFLSDMKTIIRDVQAACAPMTVLTTVYHMTGWKSYPPFDRGSPALLREYNEAIRRLAAETACVLADVWEAERETDWLIHPDGVHANTVGNLVIAHRIFETIAQSASGLTIRAFDEARDTKWTKDTLGRREQDGDPFQKTW